jgi:LacI family transcriptional regulator
MAVLRALHAEGLEHKIAVVGFDDLPAAELLSPGLTLVKQNLAEIGRLSIQTLLGRIDGDSSKSLTQVVPTTLVPMGSGEIRPK